MSRREFDLLAGQVRDDRARVENIDANGTRGVGVIQNQQLQIVKDMSELKADLNTRFALHERVHEQDEAARRSRARWAWTFAIGFGSMLTGVLAVVVDIAGKLH